MHDQHAPIATTSTSVHAWSSARLVRRMSALGSSRLSLVSASAARDRPAQNGHRAEAARGTGRDDAHRTVQYDQTRNPCRSLSSFAALPRTVRWHLTAAFTWVRTAESQASRNDEGAT
jgi:hypothetical protein